MVKELPLTKGYVALVDDEDFERINAFKWQAHLTPRRDGTVRVYGFRTHAKKGIYLHRFILNAPKGVDVDHKNGDGLDCRRSNMRLATRSQNLANLPWNAANTSGFKGVSFHKQSGRIQVVIGYRNRRYHIGLYDDPAFAAAVYDAAARHLFGSFANTNFDIPNPAAEAIIAARFARDERIAA
jgi:hypothetical protein